MSLQGENRPARFLRQVCPHNEPCTIYYHFYAKSQKTQEESLQGQQDISGADECRIAASRLIYVLVSKYLVTIASPPRVPSKDHLIKPHMPTLVTHARRKKDFF
jgi:hypothetical protein